MKNIKHIRQEECKPRVIVLSGYGLNCEEETKYAFELAGGMADIVHINDLIKNPKILSNYQILAFPGGFSYGDDTGSGKAFANKFINHLKKELAEFLSRDTLAIGICNGFQIMTNLGILPGGLAHNKNGMYLDRWVDLEIKNNSPWLKGIKKLSVPIAHGEGNFTIAPDEYKKMLKNKQIALVYVKGEICKFQALEKNPNGAMHDIAGVSTYNGRVLGLMPHPERAMFSHQNPMWQNNKKVPDEGAGLQIFINAINYFSAKGGSAFGGK
ncbi:MAG: phosphoribosylformylglycinamidine synthase subunit PurQ [bacterium]